MKDRTSQPEVGRENAVKSCEINPWLGHQGCELRDKVQGLKDDVCGAVAIRGFQFVSNLTMTCQCQALLRNSGSAHVAAKSLEFIPLMHFGYHS